MNALPNLKLTILIVTCFMLFLCGSTVAKGKFKGKGSHKKSEWKTISKIRSDKNDRTKPRVEIKIRENTSTGVIKYDKFHNFSRKRMKTGELKHDHDFVKIDPKSGESITGHISSNTTRSREKRRK